MPNRIALYALATLFLSGCGANLDAIGGNATLSNGTITGNISVSTPLGTFYYPPPPLNIR